MRAAAREQVAGARGSLTRARILAEAARIFNRRGYHGTTLDDVARALGVTKAALYYHVRSKEELLFQCHQVLIEIALEGIRRARERASAADEQLRLTLAHYIEGIMDQLRGSVVLLEEGALTPAHQRQVIAGRDEYERQLREIIARGVRDGVFVPCDPKLVGFALLGAGNWIPKWYSPAGSRAPKEIAEAFASYLARGLQRQPSIDAILPLAEAGASA
ncbi:MAG: TetR/AcrR family transcriptional regulator [Candidatus Rokubacteria bacterium]|nr:TetR/AcrR family transcriptional regulator [Candidatus Rokubacteria bacterium]